MLDDFDRYNNMDIDIDAERNIEVVLEEGTTLND